MTNSTNTKTQEFYDMHKSAKKPKGTQKLTGAFAHKNANIGYIVAGFPSLEHTKNMLLGLDESKLDILELSIPYSDPIADGKIIEAAAFEAIKNGINTDDIFNLLEEVETKKPLVFLVYYNLILAYGIEKFVARSKKAGISAFIVPDLPVEENKFLYKILQKNSIALVPLITSTSVNRLAKILKRAQGFIYCVAVVGITGGAQIDTQELEQLIAKIRTLSNLPIGIGFGIKTNIDVQKMRKLADATIVGTKIVELCGKYPTNTYEKIDALFATN